VVEYYIPDRGDLITMDLEPQTGTEMAKRRPCLVLSEIQLNRKLKRAIICPITSSAPKIKTHIALPNSVEHVQGSIIVDQVKSLDFVQRKARFLSKLDDNRIYDEVINVLRLLVSGD